MPRNILLLAIYVCAIYVAFAVLSVLVKISRGHPALVNRKLQVGALLLAALPLLSACDNPFSARRDGSIATTPLKTSVTSDTLVSVPTCYAVAVVQSIYLDDSLVINGTVTVDYGKPSGTRLTGSIDRSMDNATPFSYAITDTSGRLITAGDIAADDGAIDSLKERFTINVPPMLDAGSYQLRLYDCGVAGQNFAAANQRVTYRLRIVGQLFVTCYFVGPARPMIAIDSTLMHNNAVFVARTVTSTIRASIDGGGYPGARPPASGPLSFRIIAADSSVVQSGDITPADGVWDQAVEPFLVNVAPEIPDGAYVITFFQSTVEAQSAGVEMGTFPLTIGQEFPLSVIR